MAKTISIILGIVFVLVGILGIMDTGIVGSTEAMFMTNMLHDIIHLASGLVFLIVGFAASSKASLTMKIFGAVYLLVAILGFIAPEFTMNLLAVNDADNWLHLVLGVVIFGLGWWTGKSSASAVSQPMM